MSEKNSKALEGLYNIIKENYYADNLEFKNEFLLELKRLTGNDNLGELCLYIMSIFDSKFKMSQ